MRDKKVAVIPCEDRLIWIAPDQVPIIWPEISHYLHEANAYGGGKFELHDWLARILNGKAELYVNLEKTCCAICEVAQFPRKRVYVIDLLGGDGGHDYATYQRQFELAAKRYGCETMEIYGRAGWKRIMNEMNYSLAHFVWRKEL